MSHEPGASYFGLYTFSLISILLLARSLRLEVLKK